MFSPPAHLRPRALRPAGARRRAGADALDDPVPGGRVRHLAPALAVAADRPGGQRHRRLPHRLRLLSQPEELGRVQQPPRRGPAEVREMALPRTQPGPPAPPGHRARHHGVRPHAGLPVLHLPRPVVGGRRAGRHRPDPRRVRVPHLGHVALDPGRRLLLPDPVAGTVRQRAPGLHVLARQRDHAHADGLPEPASTPARGALGPRRVQQHLGVRQPARRVQLPDPARRCGPTAGTSWPG